jgi:hypothetical protein
MRVELFADLSYQYPRELPAAQDLLAEVISAVDGVLTGHGFKPNRLDENLDSNDRSGVTFSY